MTPRWICALFGTAMLVSGSFSQTVLSNPVGQFFAYREDSGIWPGAAEGPASVYRHTVRVDRAAWMRLFFDQFELPAGSVIRMTSLLDGEVQELGARDMAMWSQSSAYFNGDAVELELVAAAGSSGNRISISRVEVEFSDHVLNAGPSLPERGNSTRCGICATDDRVQANEQWACRLMSGGCTASVISTGSCLISAGHCVAGNLVAQFNVPNSTPGCATVNPPIADQFPITSWQHVNVGVGDDWSVLRTGTNSLDQRPFQRYGKLRRIAPALAAEGNPIAIFGYGADDLCMRSMTQQFSTGPITRRGVSTYEFTADVRLGSSGSGLIKDGQIIGVVTHCNVNCPNLATRVDRPEFAAARAALCQGCIGDINGDGIVDIRDLSAFLSMFGSAYPHPSFNPAGDLDSDNAVDVNDLSQLLSQFGEVCD